MMTEVLCSGMEVLNRAIESIMNSTDRDEWEPSVIHITDNILSLWKGQVTSSSSSFFMVAATRWS